MQTKEQRQFRIKFSAMIVLLLIVVLAAISIGQYAVTPLDMVKSISNRLFDTVFQYDINTDTILYRVRLPRILLGILIGSGLSCAGATYPMVSPDLLGASWGAGFGAALGLLFALPYVWISVIAFAFGLLAVYLTYFVGAHCKGSKKLGFILGGIMIGSLFSAGVSYIKLAADPMDNTACHYLLADGKSGFGTSQRCLSGDRTDACRHDTDCPDALAHQSAVAGRCRGAQHGHPG